MGYIGGRNKHTLSRRTKIVKRLSLSWKLAERDNSVYIGENGRNEMDLKKIRI
jgi:hypothetical protein